MAPLGQWRVWGRKWAWILLLLSVLIGGCSFPPLGETPSEVQRQASSRFVLKLPRVDLYYTEDGVLTVDGVSTVEVYEQFGIDVRSFNLPPSVVQAMSRAGVAQLEVRQTASGVTVWADGRPLPGIAWDARSLRRFGALLPALGVKRGEIAAVLLPLLRFVEVDVAVHFPSRPGGNRSGIGGPTLGAEAASPSGPVTVLRLEVRYDEAGRPTWVADGMATRERLGSLAQLLTLRPEVVRRLIAANIQHVRFVVRRDGLLVYANNEPLPRVVWDPTSLGRALALYGAVTGLDDPASMMVWRQVVAFLGETELDVLLRFPTPAGVTPIPVLEPPAR